MPIYTLRLFRDSLAAKTTNAVTNATLAARPRIILCREGVVGVRSNGQLATLGAFSAWHGSGDCTISGGAGGGTALRWEIAPLDAAIGPGELVLDSPITLAANEPHLMRCDRVDFPIGGIAYTHTHRGPGIRYLLAGGISVRTQGHEHGIKPNEAWFESGPDPVLALASDTTTTAFARVMVLPRELIGKSSIKYVLPEDQDKPKRQTYQLFADEPIEL